MNPLVSICIPAYNAEKWIADTIKSALSQTWPNKEIIIVDDGSTDKTVEVVKNFQNKKIKLITQQNSGACIARNKALSFAQGDFIQWLDSDDVLAPDKIEKQLVNSDQNPESRILHSSAWGYFYFRLNKARFLPTPLWKDLSPKDWLIYHIRDGHFMYPAVWLVSRKLTELAGSWNEDLLLNQDGEYFARVVAASEYVKFHSEAKSYYRKGNLTSISQYRSKEKIESLNIARNLTVNHLLKIDSGKDSKSACIEYLLRMNKILSFYNNTKSLILKNNNRIVELGGIPSTPSYSLKYNLLKKIIGPKLTNLLKKKLWQKKILIERNWDYTFYLLEKKWGKYFHSKKSFSKNFFISYLG